MLPRNIYAPLAAYLTALSPETVTVTLTLAEIARILGRPPSPRMETAQFWHSGPSQASPRAWLGAGWRVSHVLMRIEQPTVTFTRAA